MNKIEIFKPGRFTAADGTVIELSDEGLKAIAAAYDPKLHEAPLVIGHPKTDLPAHGWVKGLEFSESAKRLLADPDQVEPQFAEMVGAGRFKKISASFYTPDSPRNPAVPGPGGKKPFYLRHVGFLGAMPPAVPGLKSVSFGEEEAGIATVEFSESDSTLAWLFRSLREWMISKWNKDEAEKALPGYAISDLERAATKEELLKTPQIPAPSVGFAETDKEEPMPLKPEEIVTREADLKKKEVDFSEREKTIATRETDLSEREKRIKADETRLRKSGYADFVEGLVKAGKILPAQKANLVEFMSAIAETGVVEFGEGEKKTQKAPLDFFKEFIATLPDQVHFGELIHGTVENAGVMTSEALAAKAVEFQESEKQAGRHVSVAQAVAHIKNGGTK